MKQGDAGGIGGDRGEVRLPARRGLFYGGAWHAPESGAEAETLSPGTGRSLGVVAQASAKDVDAAVAAARKGFLAWRDVAPRERARILRAVAARIRQHADELALLDAVDCGNPCSAMRYDSHASADQLEFFSGLVTEMKGSSVPMGPQVVNFSVRQPLGVVAKIVAFNHPFMFCAGKAAAPLAAGNAVIVKPPEQAPLSALRFAELIEDLVPAGVFNVLPGGKEAGAALAAHPGVAKISVIGSVQTGRAVLAAGAATLKPALLELGGKNALIAFDDADPEEVASAVIDGMNFAWCGQSCGSTSRALLHETIYDRVVEHVLTRITAFRPGDPADPSTTMGAIVSAVQHRRILDYIEIGKAEGARLLHGGKTPDDPALAGGYFIEPTVFGDVTPQMRIAREEIFGPVVSLMRWRDEAEMIDVANGVDYGLTCSIWTNDLERAHRTAMKAEAGYVWINETGKHFLGAPFGGWKQSGIGREECLDELLAYTQEKNIHIRLKGGSG